MKAADWKDCLDDAQARQGRPDPAKARSLRETAHARMEFLDMPPSAESLNFIFEGLYTSFLELLHAHLLEQGIIVRNHVCMGYYLRDELDRPDLFRIFDDCRYKRNALVYYGKRMPERSATNALQQIRSLIDAIIQEGAL